MPAQLSVKNDLKFKKEAQLKAKDQGLPLTIEYLFHSKKIINKANLISDYLSTKFL